MDTKIKNEIISLRKNSKTAFVSSVDENGFPAIKAMLVLENCKHKNTLFFHQLVIKKSKTVFEKSESSRILLQY